MKLLVLKVAHTGAGVPWRRVRVPADITLDDLHIVVQAVMGWDESRPHRWKLGAARTTDGDMARVDAIFTAPDVSVAYVHDDGYELTLTAETLQRTEARSNDDFAVLAADVEVATLNDRLRRAFFTVAYNPDRDPGFTAWGDRERVSAFEEAVMRALSRREPHQPGVHLRQRTRLQCVAEELLASPSMTILRDALERLKGQGLTRGEALDAFVALAASLPGDVTNVEEQVHYLTAIQNMTADSYRSTFPGGPIPVIAARLGLDAARKRNQRRRRR